MVSTDVRFEADLASFSINSLGWLAHQLKLDLSECASLVRQIHKSFPLDAIASSPVPPDKAAKLLGTKSARDATLQLNAAPSPSAAPQDKGEMTTTTAEQRRLTLSEVRGVAATAGVAQKLVRQLDETCFNRQQELHALRGYHREQQLIEADNTGRLIARLEHTDRLNDELDDIEIELAQNTSRASDLASRLFGVNLQSVIDNQGDMECDRAEAREEMARNYEAFEAQEKAKEEAEAKGEEYQAPEGERLGEDALIDPWLMARRSLSQLEAKRTSKLRKGAV